MQDEANKLEENDEAETTNEKKGKIYLADYDRLLSLLAWEIACQCSTCWETLVINA